MRYPADWPRQDYLQIREQAIMGGLPKNPSQYPQNDRCPLCVPPECRGGSADYFAADLRPRNECLRNPIGQPSIRDHQRLEEGLRCSREEPTNQGEHGPQPRQDLQKDPAGG